MEDAQVQRTLLLLARSLSLFICSSSPVRSESEEAGGDQRVAPVFCVSDVWIVSAIRVYYILFGVAGA